MKGYRFYKEYNSTQDKRKDKPAGNVFAAVLYPNNTTRFFTVRGETMLEGIGSVYADPNSPCAYTSASWDWLRTQCKHISEAEARKIHPALFAYLED